MTIKSLLHVPLIMTIIVAILTVIAFIVILRVRHTSAVKTKDGKKTHRIGKRPLIAIITLGVAILLCGGTALGSYLFINTALRHGMYDNSITVAEAYESIKHSPREDKLPEDITDTLVIYYRFGCDECEALYDTLKDEVKKFEKATGDKIYWVSTRSEQGKTLRSTCHAANLTVPSIMYIRISDAERGTQFYLETIYYRDPEGTHFYPTSWDKIIEIRDQYTDGKKFAE